MTKFSYTALAAKQAPNSQILSFPVRAKEILAFAEIDRVNRASDGSLAGFQRHQIASHIHEIRDYLRQDTAVLPNPIVIAFINGVTVTEKSPGIMQLEIDTSSGKPGYVVDGQQRLTALSELIEKDFQVFVSALVCRDYDEMRQQFILINNTRPLPKSLIYELLPSTPGLPERLTSRALAAKLVDMLNYDERSSLYAQIYQHTNPTGVIRDTSIQKIIMNSLSDGVLREFINDPDFFQKSFDLISDYFAAVQEVFQTAWKGHKPSTSRLVHGAGIIGMGYVMEYICSRFGILKRHGFVAALQPLVLKSKTAWTNGVWYFSDSDQRPWNKVQNVPQDIMVMARYLVKVIKE